MNHLCSLTDAERKLRAQIAVNASWARRNDAQRTAHTAPARKAFEDKFLAAADGDPKRAENLRKAHFQRMALKSSQARRRRSGRAA